MSTSRNPESLLNIFLVEQMLSDRSVTLMPRAIDASWYYERDIPISVSGFNPSRGAIYYPSTSTFASFLKDPTGSARGLNVDDRLVRECLMAVHDYLHTWAYRAIDYLLPGLGFGSAPITTTSFEAFVFCHLLTETVATVGLDYWFLSTVDLNTLVDIGTRMGPLTVPYRERFLPEYQRAFPDFHVQRPSFFAWVANLYCSGRAVGFDADDIRKSPILLSWMRKELAYGRLQRRYTRQWLAWLGGQKSACDLDAPVAQEADWQSALVNDLGILLWEKVKERRLHDYLPLAPDKPWESSRQDRDFRFLNLVRARESAPPRALLDSETTVESTRFLCYQLISGKFKKTIPPSFLPALRAACAERNPAIIHSLIGAFADIEVHAPEPSDLFLLN